MFKRRSTSSHPFHAHFYQKNFDQGFGLMFKSQFTIAHPFPFVILTKDFNERVSMGEFTKFSFI
jgi:hypothetical protein